MADQERAARLKAALRENLKRRKQQARKRAGAADQQRAGEDTGRSGQAKDAADDGSAS